MSGTGTREPVPSGLCGLLAGATYALYIALLRGANADPRRLVTPLLVATLGAAAATAALGATLGELPGSVSAHAWWLALSLGSQVAWATKRSRLKSPA